MKKILFAAILMFTLTTCNKEIDTVELPPFSVFPNPFTDSFTLYFDSSVSAFSTVNVYDGAEEVIVRFDELAINTGTIVDMSSREKGVYYVELTTEGETYIQTILKTE
ncbi:MAG: T9SS C-terminal target domain-containing protein [Bacteroidetes bacterium]|nr:MAG: T9SS C-terminal target domain-containing protein [Bacteroidota bacterium]